MHLRRRVRHRPEPAEGELARPVHVVEAAEPRPDEPLVLRGAAVPPLLHAHTQRAWSAVPKRSTIASAMGRRSPAWR